MAIRNDLTKMRDQLQDQFGPNSAMFASDMPKRDPISSGTLALDYALGIGGFPADRVIEIAGEERTGKTTLGLLAMANFLDANPKRGALILDTEHKLESAWIRQLIGEERESRVLTLWPDTMEQATNMYIDAVAGNEKKKIPAGRICFAMLDSIGGTPTDRRNDDYEVPGFGGNSLAVTEFSPIAAIKSRVYECLTVGINQVREDMSGYHRHLTPGGRAWKHYCTMRLALKRGKGKLTTKVNNEEVQIGYEVACKVVKNGMAADGRTTAWWFHNVATEQYGFGVDRWEEAARLSLLTGVIERKGGWYHHELLPNGKILGYDRLQDHIKVNTGFYTALSGRIMHVLQSGNFGNEVAPMSDPEVPIEESHYEHVLGNSPFPDDPHDMSQAQLDHVVGGLQREFRSRDD